MQKTPTLRVKVTDNFEVQYTHLADAPIVRDGQRISRGDEIGTYGDFGFTGGNPHFHITYKTVLTNNMCASDDITNVIFENPLLSLTHRFWVPTTLHQPPPHIRSGKARQQNSIWRVNNRGEYITPQW